MATPAALHYAGARAALRAGKDVFVEKPLALRYRDGWSSSSSRTRSTAC